MLSFVFDAWSCFFTAFTDLWYTVLCFPILIAIICLIKELINHV